MTSVRDKTTGLSKKVTARRLYFALIASLAYLVLAVGFAYFYLFEMQSSESPYAALLSVELSGWGDFLAGVCSPLALAWIIASVIIQGNELKEQRLEMSRQAEAVRTQADAVTTQSTYIKDELDLSQKDRTWREILELLDVLREEIPVKTPDNDKSDGYIRFRIDGKECRFEYVPPAGTVLDDLSTIRFLFRAIGGLSYPFNKIEKALELQDDLAQDDTGVQDACKIDAPKSNYKFKRMSEIVEAISKLSGDLPDNQKFILKSCRIDELHAMLTVISSRFYTAGP